VKYANINFLITAEGHLMSNLTGIFLSVTNRRKQYLGFIGLVWILLLLSGPELHAQNPLGRFGNMGGGGGGKSGAGDTLVHRKADTITLNIRFLDSSRLIKLDSSIIDFSRKVPEPPTWINLGNIGTPARDLMFSPRMLSGWDPGWHAYDLYTFKVEDTKFYNTTKPYTELGYLLGSKSVQFIDVQSTQNIRPNWNASFEYRLINSVGAFQNENTNHNNYRLSSWYQSHNKRYQNFFVLVASKLAASDNGGLQNPSDLDSNAYTNQATVPVRLGNNLARASSNPFSPIITTGTRYTNATLLFRQQYDLGQKDSIVTDTTVVPLFYPRLRLEHTISYSTYTYRFTDQYNPGIYSLDSLYYAQKYNLGYILPTDSFYRQDHWRDLTNDFSVYQFPDSKNPQQFFKAGIALQLLKGVFDTARLDSPRTIETAHKISDQNVFIHAEYRNKTRNQKWDVEAFGKLYLNGFNAGDYNGSISLKRLISRKIGYLQVGFENTNRTPSFAFNRASSFYYDTTKFNFLKENTTHIFASLQQPEHDLTLTGSYYLMSNYSYFTDFYKERQESTLFNLLQISLRKQFNLSRVWHWRTLIIIQQTAGSSPVHVPLLVTNNQLGYDGSLGFPNLRVSFGTEIRYISGYKADGYAPLTGQFFTQGDTTIRQHLPDIALYLHLRIRSFTAYVRAENLNSMAFSPNGFGWYNNNFVAPNYPSPGLLLKFGFFWGFVN